MVGENCLHPGCAQLIYLRLALVMCVWFASLINPASCSETFQSKSSGCRKSIKWEHQSKCRLHFALPTRWRRTAGKVSYNPNSGGLHSKFSPSFSPTDRARHFGPVHPLRTTAIHFRASCCQQPKSSFHQPTCSIQHSVPVTTYFGIWLSTCCQTFKQ